MMGGTGGRGEKGRDKNKQIQVSWLLVVRSFSFLEYFLFVSGGLGLRFASG